MATQLRLDEFLPFQARSWPAPEALGRAVERNERVPGALLQLSFGGQVAGLAISDIWSACCELLLNAQLVREGMLDHFVLDAEQIFDLSYAGELLFCTFSCEHVFTVSREDFASSLEQLVDGIFAATASPGVMRIGAQWGASAIRGLPYAIRFSGSDLI